MPPLEVDVEQLRLAAADLRTAADALPQPPSNNLALNGFGTQPETDNLNSRITTALDKLRESLLRNADSVSASASGYELSDSETLEGINKSDDLNKLDEERRGPGEDGSSGEDGGGGGRQSDDKRSTEEEEAERRAEKEAEQRAEDEVQQRAEEEARRRAEEEADINRKPTPPTSAENGYPSGPGDTGVAGGQGA